MQIWGGGGEFVRESVRAIRGKRTGKVGRMWEHENPYTSFYLNCKISYSVGMFVRTLRFFLNVLFTSSKLEFRIVKYFFEARG